MKSLFFALICLTSSCFALETKPWFGDEFAFDFQTAFTYSRYHKVEGAKVQLSRPRNDFDFLFDLTFTPSSRFECQAEVEFAKTTLINWNIRSAAFQGRYQILDDISGDPLSLVFGLSARWANSHFLTDVGTPYAAEGNFEVFGSAGKEWSSEGMWTSRLYGFASIGMATNGYPWTRELFVWEHNWQDTHRLSLFTAGNFGFGNKQNINVDRFHGWGRIQHQSIDIGVAYGYQFDVWGTLSASYSFRVFAHNYPEWVNSFMVSYCLPFSLF